MNSDYLDDRHFDKLDNKILIELLVLFEKDPNTNSDVFFEIKDNIWEEGTCYPDFYIMVPQLIRIASSLDISISKDLWSYLGCWISTQKYYRKDVCGEILDDFDKVLEYAEKECINQICTIEKFDVELCQYLGHKKLNFSPSIAYAERIIFMLPEPHLQPVVVSCNQEHYGAFFGYRMTLYIQRVLI